MTDVVADRLDLIVQRCSVVICCGPGGVGKTTVAAALALGGALAGRRTCVVTIDPARRLADALGLHEMTNAPTRIDGPWHGTLDAVALDAKVTFDDLVRHNASDTDQADRILENRLYRNLASALSGTQEYMATEKLYELHDTGAYDLVVVDTPPSRNALDFLAAPDRLSGFLDNRVFRALIAPSQSGLRAVGRAAQIVVGTIGRIAGSEIVEDTLTFFRAFSGMEDGFRARADAVAKLLSSSETSFVLVGTARPEATTEVEFFVDALERSGRHVGALVVNRMLPNLGQPVDMPRARGPWTTLIENLNDLAAEASREEELVGELERRVAPAPTVRVPFLASDVHDLGGLDEVVRYLFGRTVP